MARSTPGNYVPLDVNYARDSSIRRAGPDAELLYIRALAYAKGAKSNGHVPDYDLDVVAVGLKKVSQRVAALVAQNLWLITDGGWRIRSWEPWNSADEAESAAGKLAAHIRHHVKDGKRSDDCEHCESPPPTDAIASTTAVEPPDAIADPVAVPPHMQGKGREVVVSSVVQSSPVTRANGQSGLDDLDRICERLAGLRPGRPIDRTWAAKIQANFAMPPDVRNPINYLLAALDDDPDRYLPTHQPEPYQPSPNPTGPPAANVNGVALAARQAIARKDAP
jgi:hypothetical protein